MLPRKQLKVKNNILLKINKMSGCYKDGKPHRKKKSRSSRGGLQFPVGRIHRLLNERKPSSNRISDSAPVYLTAVLEYLTAEILVLASKVTNDHCRQQIIPR